MIRRINLVAISAVFITTITVFFIQNIHAQDSQSLVRAGLRSSIYGFDSFPDSSWWFNATTDMASRFPGTSPAVIWILGYTTNNGCYLNFPKPNPDSSYSNIYFSNIDGNESFLNDFDDNGVKVWLQVEPGQADILTLIDLVLTQYGHHPSVIGFGVDVEWYKTSTHNEGKAVTDEESEAWSARIKTYNGNYLLFTKHWLISKMPPTFRNDIVFVDDSQIFPDMASMIAEFEDWGKAFLPAKVAFQYGYNSDKKWWESLADPPKEIGDEILKRCPNTSDLYWVDFTAYDIWPEDFTPTSISNNNIVTKPDVFSLHQNYPNPFNSETNISYTIVKKSNIIVTIFDVQGRLIKEVFSGYVEPGTYRIKLRLDEFSSGVYFYCLMSGENIKIGKMTLIK